MISFLININQHKCLKDVLSIFMHYAGYRDNLKLAKQFIIRVSDFWIEFYVLYIIHSSTIKKLRFISLDCYFKRFVFKRCIPFIICLR